MSKSEGRGTRASSWLKVQRCLLILRRLQRGPASVGDLIWAVEAGLGPSAYGQAPEKALERDVGQLRESFDVTIRSRLGVYNLDDVGDMPLLDLPDDALDAMAFLYHTFEYDAPDAAGVRGLLDTIATYLPPERHELAHRARTVPELDVQRVDRGPLDDSTWEALERAVVRGRQLAFDYSRPGQRLPAEHVVEPYELPFRTGHYYLDAYCLRWQAPTGEKGGNVARLYRVDRILPGSARVLPTKLPPGRRTARTYTLSYELAPEIAEGGVSRRFPEMQVDIREDGWAEVTAEISNPFMAAQILLRYGGKCHVLQPPEVVRMMEEAARELAQIYG
jgi:predicted DNA-binding transcriptional regulator YafY